MRYRKEKNKYQRKEYKKFKRIEQHTCYVLLFENEINIYLATLIIFTGIVFDFLDGFFARKLNNQSKLGLELDSLADLITSGLVPGIIIFRLFKIPNDLTFSIISNEWFAYFAFIITISSAYRLAKFNIQENSKNRYISIPKVVQLKSYPR